MAEQPKSNRNRRNANKKNREDIYCYDNPVHELNDPNEQDFDDQMRSEYDLPLDDDSFSYNGPRIRKS